MGTEKDDFQGDFNVSRETMERLSIFVELLNKWQKRINLVSRKSLSDVWRRHILDSAQLLQYLPSPRKGGEPLRIADLGSGAGFPGLILAIMSPGQVDLFESDGRKCAFLTEAIRLTGASARVCHQRIETYDGPLYDVVTSRALADLSQLFTMTRPIIKKEGICLFLKGQDIEFELTQATKCWKMQLEIHRSRSDNSGRVLVITGLEYGPEHKS